MNPGPDTVELLTPRILVVDDERQIHASLRLRLGRDYDLVFCFDAREALARLKQDRFDLCFADIHMPNLDGLAFIEQAQKTDANLAFVVLSAFDTDQNLRRAIPLRVCEFIPKPLPERDGFEARIPEWIALTRRRRREHELAQQTETLVSDRESARLERDVELVASESARDALLQTANLLTTIHAHLVTATGVLSSRGRADPALNHLLRNLEEARRTADAAVTVAEGFFDSSYGSRDSSPARLNEGIRHAMDIALRMTRGGEALKTIEYAAGPEHVAITALSGIDFLLMMVPALGIAVASSAPNTTVGITSETFTRLDALPKDPRFRSHVWMNRGSGPGGRAGILLIIRATAAAWPRSQVEAWIKGEYTPLATITPRGLVSGIKKCQGLIGLSVAPALDHFRLLIALPI